MTPQQARRLCGHFDAVAPMDRRGETPATWVSATPMTRAQADRIVELLESIDERLARIAARVG